MIKKTSQENFWKKEFGNKYTSRNSKSFKRINVIGNDLRKNNLKINSAFEIGCNIGLNLLAIKKLYPKARISGVEINYKAYTICKKNFTCYNKSLYEFETNQKFEIVISAGVLIHQNPKMLKLFYKKMYDLSKKYIYLSEYFNPTPVELTYRGYKGKLFKRDFAKELWKKYPKMKLIDYGFHWTEDPKKKGHCDNSNWFLFKK
jgi:spore coat polysaccharide biosynthesis protein SpsF